VVARGRTATGVGLTLTLAALACKNPSPSSATTGAKADASPPPQHCQVLRERLCAQFGQGSEVCAMATTETAAYRPERCAAMLARYEHTATSAQRFAEAKGVLLAREQLTPHGPAPTVGPVDAAVTFVLFADFDDPDCGRVSLLATTLKNLYPDRARLVFRQFPLTGHPDAHLAAEASLAAHAQGKFWAFHDILFGNPQDHGRAALERYAKAAGLALAPFKQALDEHRFSADVDADLALGHQLSVTNLPAFYMNGKSVQVPYGPTELEALFASSTQKP
jgi:protein-disulfide isomerase